MIYQGLTVVNRAHVVILFLHEVLVAACHGDRRTSGNKPSCTIYNMSGRVVPAYTIYLCKSDTTRMRML